MSASRDHDHTASALEGGYTPGPWIRCGGGYQVLTGDSWNVICVLHSGSGERWQDHRLAAWEDGRSASDLEANAQLIAAAPVLLEALKAIVEHNGYEVPNALIAQAEAAISKAEGK